MEPRASAKQEPQAAVQLRALRGMRGRLGNGALRSEVWADFVRGDQSSAGAATAPATTTRTTGTSSRSARRGDPYLAAALPAVWVVVCDIPEGAKGRQVDQRAGSPSPGFVVPGRRIVHWPERWAQSPG
jgi:hypothetical protein